MISGPTIPNTLSSLRSLLIERVELIEHGLRVLSEDLVLGNDAGVDLLACDATGAPALLFIAVPETSPQLPARLIGAASWLRQNGAFLAREIQDPYLRATAAPRLLVVGLDIFADTLAELRRARIDGLSVLQLCSFTVGGRLRVGVTPLIEPSFEGRDVGRLEDLRPGFAAEPAETTPSGVTSSGVTPSGVTSSGVTPSGVIQVAGSSSSRSSRSDAPEIAGPRPSTATSHTGAATMDPIRDGFVIPEGLVEPGQRALAARFLDLARRVDGRLTAAGTDSPAGSTCTAGCSRGWGCPLVTWWSSFPKTGSRASRSPVTIA